MNLKFLKLYGLLMCFQLFANAQGLNNKFKLDDQDILNIFELQDISVHKFNIASKNLTKLNIIIYQYVNGVFKDSINMYTQYSKKGIPIDLLPTINNKKALLRFYLRKLNKQAYITFNYKNNRQTINLAFDSIQSFGSRTFDVKYTQISKRERILSMYGVYNSSKEMHCALNDSNADLAKRMDNVIIIYIEPINNL